jgi:hypothetical protein
LCAGAERVIVTRMSDSMPRDWKRITYRGGLVEFRVPASWLEEYEEDGGAAFYEPTPDSDTLRLNVLTFRSASPVTPETPLDLLRPRAQKYGVTARRLPNGNAMISYSERAEEQGVPLLIHYWEVANVVPPTHARIAVLSFTTRALEGIGDADTLEWLEEEIRALRFSAELGVAG